MKDIKMVRIKSTSVGFGGFKGVKYRFEEVEEIIRNHLKAGYEYLGYVPYETRATGDIETMTLIFQRDES